MNDGPMSDGLVQFIRELGAHRDSFFIYATLIRGGGSPIRQLFQSLLS